VTSLHGYGLHLHVIDELGSRFSVDVRRERGTTERMADVLGDEVLVRRGSMPDLCLERASPRRGRVSVRVVDRTTRVKVHFPARTLAAARLKSQPVAQRDAVQRGHGALRRIVRTVFDGKETIVRAYGPCAAI
jgi:hypothetical protein